jgi:hypothetical protein
MVGSLQPGLPFEEIPPELQGPSEGVFPGVEGDAAPPTPIPTIRPALGA